MKRFLTTVVVALGSIAAPAVAAAAPPANDNLEAATQVAALPFTATVELAEATFEPFEPLACAYTEKSVWYTYTPTDDVVVEIDAAGSATPATNISLYQAVSPGLGGLSFRACSGVGGSIVQSLQAGVTYYIQETLLFGNTPGAATLNVRVQPPPPFDEVEGATEIGSLAYFESNDSSRGSSAPDDPSCFDSRDTVWYVYRPAEDMRIEAGVQPTFSNDPGFTLSAYSGSPDSLRQLACSDASAEVSGYPIAHVEIDAEAGVPLYFMVGTPSRAGGGFVLRVQRPLDVTVAFDVKGTVRKDGTATVTGTMSCSRSIGQSPFVTLRQTFSRLVAFGGAASSGFLCPPEGVRFAQDVMSFPVLFGPGQAEANMLNVNLCDLEGCQPGALYGQGYSPTIVAGVRLRRSG